MHPDVSPARDHRFYLSCAPPRLAATATGRCEIQPAAVPEPAMPFTKVLPRRQRPAGAAPARLSPRMNHLLRAHQAIEFLGRDVAEPDRLLSKRRSPGVG